MNWIAKWLAERCEYTQKQECSECDRVCTAKRKLAKDADCPPELISLLVQGYYTHPNFADRIADYTGATDAQRDRLVHPKHRGMRKNAKKHKRATDTQKPGLSTNQRIPRIVVALDRLGNEIDRFPSVFEAGEHMGVSETPVRDRCNGRFPSDKDEFKSFGMTFRYAKDWDFMTEEERFASITRCKRGERTK